KPPHPQVAARVLERIGRSSKPYTVCFLGAERAEMPTGATQVFSLREAAEHALGGARIANGSDIASFMAGKALRSGRIDGLFTGGTLCAEAQLDRKSTRLNSSHV